MNAAVTLNPLARFNDADAIAARAFHSIDGYGRHDLSSCFNVDVVILFMGFSDMLDHVGLHLANVTVRDAVEDLLALLVRPRRALDDYNVERFCDLLEAMRQRADTRFVVITHNPITMARMDRLFGVAMAKRGVSQLVSVELAEAERLAEAG